MRVTKYLLTALTVILLASCSNCSEKKDNVSEQPYVSTAPTFNVDSAFAYVKAQCAFGPRVMNSAAHDSCGDYIVSQFKKYGGEVYEQFADLKLYDGTPIKNRNIIASFNKDAQRRIIICSHWDSRPWADHDPDEANHHTPIDGANDGASGVGVLIECARCFREQPLNEKLGVDLIFFDLEDYGPRQDQSEQYYDDRRNHWALGSQYWAAHPHIPGYQASYGILLDMVGNSNPNFMKEYYSQGYAAWLSNKVWRTAQNLGYDQHFVNELGDPISDDHLPMNEIAGIPTIDIIDLRPESSNQCFHETWHTLQDTFENIDKNSLGMVGNVLNYTVYQE